MRQGIQSSHPASVFGLLLCHGLWATMLAGESPKPALQISGEASVFRSPAGGATVTRPFKLAVNGSNWWITTHETSAATRPTDFHWQNFNVSAGLLARCYYSPKVGRLMANLRPQAAPVACPDQISHFIWLMLTPSIHADAANRVTLPPVYNPSADLGTNPDLRRRCEVEYLDESRLWLKTIRFYSDGTINRYSNGTNSAVRYPKPYGAGFLEARFETVAVTNWHGLAVPWRVKGEWYGPGNGRSADELKTNGLIEIHVTALQALPANVKLPPPPDPNTSITDSRAPVARNQGIGFYVDDGQWPTLETAQAVVEEDKRARKELGLPPRE